MRRDRWFLFAGIIILAVLFVLNLFFGIFGKRFFARNNQNVLTESERLHAENVKLKSEIDQLSEIKTSISDPLSAGAITAFVYSRYPFNIKSEFLASAGLDKGIVAGSAVLFEGLFVGKVKEVYRSSSLVETIFDSSFQMAVRSGSPGVDGLLAGGIQPRITLIPKTASLEGGDAVYTAASNMPYGLSVGEIQDFSIKNQDAFGEAVLSLSYNLSDVKVVEIIPTK